MINWLLCNRNQSSVEMLANFIVYELSLHCVVLYHFDITSDSL